MKRAAGKMAESFDKGTSGRSSSKKATKAPEKSAKNKAETAAAEAVRKNTRGFPGMYQPGRKMNLAVVCRWYSTVQYSTVQYSTVLQSVLKSPSRE